MARAETITSAANPLVKDVRRAIARGTLTGQGWSRGRDLSPARRGPAQRLRGESGAGGRIGPLGRRGARSPAFRRQGSGAARRADSGRFGNRSQPGRDRAGQAAGVETGTGVPRAHPGGGARRPPGPRQRGHHRALRRGLRRHRTAVPQGHREPVQSQDSAGLGRIAVPRSLSARHGRLPGPRRPAPEQGGTVRRGAGPRRWDGAPAGGRGSHGALRPDHRRRSARRGRRVARRGHGRFASPPCAWNR